MTPEALAYWVVRPGVGELRPAEVSSDSARGTSLVRAVFSGVSAGTERLVGLGLVPADCSEPMSCRYMEGDFTLPIKYGYDLVGTGVAGELDGARVFTMHPHQSLCAVSDGDVVRLPDDVPSPRATLIPNLETALNAVWDAELQCGESAAVVGGGSIGLLVAYVLSRGDDREPVTLVESDPGRAELAADLPWIGRVLAPDEVDAGSFDLTFHSTGTAPGLQLALDATGFEGRVIELSWYGEKPVTLELGSSFHYGRKRIVASQVTSVARSHRATHSHADRLAEVLSLLGDPALDGLLSEPIPFRRMPDLMAELYGGHSPAPLPLIAY